MSLLACGLTMTCWLAGFQGTMDPYPIEGGGDTPPVALTADQLRESTDSPLAVGDKVHSDDLVFEALVFDAENDVIVFDVAIVKVGEEFSGIPTASSAPAESGTIVRVSAPLPKGLYYWLFRTHDTHGTYSSWASFGGNAESEADFRIIGPSH